jgi:hypothetical protein
MRTHRRSNINITKKKPQALVEAKVAEGGRRREISTSTLSLFASFSVFQRNFRPNPRIHSWEHSFSSH